MFVGESSPGANKFKVAAQKLLLSVLCKLLDQRILPRHDFLEIKREAALMDPPNLRLSCEVHDFSSIKQCLCGHTAAQNAKPADLLTSFDDDRSQPFICGDACRSISGTPTPNNRQIKIILRLIHVAKMSNGSETRNTNR